MAGLGKSGGLPVVYTFQYHYSIIAFTTGNIPYHQKKNYTYLTLPTIHSTVSVTAVTVICACTDQLCIGIRLGSDLHFHLLQNEVLCSPCGQKDPKKGNVVNFSTLKTGEQRLFLTCFKQMTKSSRKFV